jgi:hypothetical protein
MQRVIVSYAEDINEWEEEITWFEQSCWEISVEFRVLKVNASVNVG